MSAVICFEMARCRNTSADWPNAMGGFDCTVHDLRRSLATGLQRLGVKKEMIEKLLNQKPAGIEVK
jgi:hypothetical protein